MGPEALTLWRCMGRSSPRRPEHAGRVLAAPANGLGYDGQHESEMTRAHVIRYSGKDVVFIDFSKATLEGIEAAIEAAIPLIRTRSPGSVLTLTDAGDITISTLANKRISEFMSANKPYVRASAVIGVSGLASAVLATLRIVTGRQIATFERREAALRWLVEQA